MKLAEIFDYLAQGELAQHYVAETQCGTIEPENYHKLIPNINMGLLELYKRFPIVRKSCLIQVKSGITNYPLRAIHSVTNGTSINKYILDTNDEPFTEDILLIEDVIDELGVVLYMNEDTTRYSVYTPIFDTVVIPAPEDGQYVTVGYRASPKKISSVAIDPEEVDIIIPPAMLEALLLYVYSKYHAGLEEQLVEGTITNFKREFEKSVDRIEYGTWYNKPNHRNTKFQLNGWR
jgi:hypothetical protein